MKHICWLHRWQSIIKYQERSLMFGYRNLNCGMFAIVGIYFCLRRHSHLIKFTSMLIIRVNSLNTAILNWCAVLLFMTRKNRMNSSFFFELIEIEAWNNRIPVKKAVIGTCGRLVKETKICGWKPLKWLEEFWSKTQLRPDGFPGMR